MQRHCQCFRRADQGRIRSPLSADGEHRSRSGALLPGAEALLGTDKVRKNELPSMGAEDFAYMLQEKPGCYVWLGNGPGAGGCTLHNPHYDFNNELIPYGISYWVRLVETALKREA